jgi:hypothetical protein
MGDAIPISGQEKAAGRHPGGYIVLGVQMGQVRLIDYYDSLHDARQAADQFKDDCQGGVFVVPAEYAIVAR